MTLKAFLEINYFNDCWGIWIVWLNVISTSTLSNFSYAYTTLLLKIDIFFSWSKPKSVLYFFFFLLFMVHVPMLTQAEGHVYLEKLNIIFTLVIFRFKFFNKLSFIS